MISYKELARINTGIAHQIIADTGVRELWQASGAKINQVGSLRTGLLMKHRDIDFHIYSDFPSPEKDFCVMGRLAANPAIEKITYDNLLSTPEECLEWHAWYRHADGELWQIDMIHIKKGSFYDGYFENVADRIKEVLSPETKDAILRLKYETPEQDKIMGIRYCQAVIGEGITNYADFREWLAGKPAVEIVEWLP